MKAVPLVCAVMLTKNRPDFARKAIEAFQRQTYSLDHAVMLIINSGAAQIIDIETNWIKEPCLVGADAMSIAQLRNIGAATARDIWKPDILIHWDDDDWSHPRRIEEQVALLQTSGKKLVGYRELVFWDSRTSEWINHPLGCGCTLCTDPETGMQMPIVHGPIEPRAWLYRSGDPRYCTGTSMCYWFKTWEDKPFPTTSAHEDDQWQMGLDRLGVSSIWDHDACGSLGTWKTQEHEPNKPRMVCRIHGMNTSTGYRVDEMLRSSEWRIAREWDGYCQRVLGLNQTAQLSNAEAAAEPHQE